VKLSIVRGDASTEVDSLEAAPPDIVAVAHRVVHGGDRFREPVLVDDEFVKMLRSLVELAPIHNAGAVKGIEAARQRFPELPHVAVFDTAFHATIPAEAATYALPERFRTLGIRRYGFHGLSVQWAAERVPVARLVVCHLGGGCSVTAVREGRSVDTSMGFTPLEGVPMATRSGTVDPGALLYLLRHGTSVGELEQALEHESGLRGLSGLDSVRDLEERDSSVDRLALGVFGYRVAGAVAAMAAALGGLDALVFTAGVGENSSGVRERICSRLRFLGIELDAEKNRAAVPDARVQMAGSSVRIAVVRAREDVVAARWARTLL
jgi:acetate kinase